MRGLVAAVGLGVLATLASAQSKCSDILSCDACTAGEFFGNGDAKECLWCVDASTNFESTTEIAGYPAGTPQYAAGLCATECPVPPSTSTVKLGITKTTVDKTPNPAFSETEPFGGLDTLAVDVDLRRGTSADFTVLLKKGPVPFQLYFLLDLSLSMKDVLAAVKSSAQDLPNSFNNDDAKIKPDPFEFGFGSFVDKSIPPFAYNRFASNYDVPTYGYKHQVDFTVNADNFQDTVAGVGISGNNDEPEGGFEAVIQALYCDTLVRWKPLDENAQRLILMTTDDLSHVAGDGIEAGLLWPHELKCQNQLFFRDNNLYISEMMNPLTAPLCKSTSGKGCWYHNVIHDYPSVDQVGQALKDRKTTLAFVVPGPNDLEKPGRNLQYQDFVSKSLGSNAIVAESPLVNQPGLEFNKIVRKTYYQLIRQKPVFQAIDGGDEDFENFYTVTSSCQVVTGNRAQSATVNIDGVDETISLLFECAFSVGSVTGAPSTSVEKLQIQSQGTFGSFELRVTSTSCTCPLPIPEDFFTAVVSKKKCNQNGVTSTDDCGTCICDKGATGTYCNCDSEGRFTKCKLGCNGGTCECGTCICPEGTYGTGCECTDLCGEQDDAKRCSGPEAGTCSCDKCLCKEGFNGPEGRCECNQNLCIDPQDPNGQKCNGRGSIDVSDSGCNCGKCECQPPYFGQYCEKCDANQALGLGIPCGDDGVCGRCTRRPSDDEDPSDDTWGCQCCFGVSPVESITGFTGNGTLCQWCSEANQCVSRDTISKAKATGETICTSGVIITTSLETNISTEEPFYAVFDSIDECPGPEPADVTAIIVGTLLGLLALILLAILLWRLYAYLNDKKEWENYEKDKARSKWQADNNPIFKSSVAEFENPIFE